MVRTSSAGALDEAFRYDGKVIVEAYVEGARDWSAGCWQ